jgi:hypothetical protein
MLKNTLVLTGAIFIFVASFFGDVALGKAIAGGKDTPILQKNGTLYINHKYLDVSKPFNTVIENLPLQCVNYVWAGHVVAYCEIPKKATKPAVVKKKKSTSNLTA